MSNAESAEAMEMPAAIATREGKLEPFDWYRRMREAAPLHRDERRDCWDAFSYDAVVRILTDEETFSSRTAPERDDILQDSLLNVDPPLHGRIRGPVEEFFTPGAVKSLAPEIRATTERLLDEAIADGDEDRMDVVDVAYSLPIHTIAELIGVPTEDREQFKQWSDTLIAGPQMTGGDRDRLDQRRMEARDGLGEYFVGMLARRREAPRDDLLSRVLELEEGERLGEYQLLGLCILLLVAGNVTTTNLITNALWCLSTRPDETESVRGDDRALTIALEEVLRYRSPVQRTVRVATTDVEVAGYDIEAGEKVVPWIGSANRDGAQFADPDTFVPDRSPNPHVSFGRGIHFCLGAPLARLEAKIALETIFDRLDAVRPIETAYRPISSTFIYGVQRFPIRYSV